MITQIFWIGFFIGLFLHRILFHISKPIYLYIMKLKLNKIDVKIVKCSKCKRIFTAFNFETTDLCNYCTIKKLAKEFN